MILLAAAQAVAQMTVADSMASAPRDLSFEAGYAVMANGTWAIEFYTRNTEDRLEWIVRRSLITSNGREQVTWLAEPDCPTVRGVVETLNNFTIGTIRVPDLRPRAPSYIPWPHPKGPPTEAAVYTIWGRGQQPDASFAHYSVSANAGIVAEWAQMAEKTLMPCWTARNP
ncbi:hypothetical protein D3C86_991780 [compost metagenome]